jgi:sugar/nucleoside kinase (ribokinase family)
VDSVGFPDALMLAPAFHEFARFPAIGARVEAVALQGVLRTVAATAEVRPTPDPVSAAAPFVAPGRLLFFSDEDTDSADLLAGHITASGGIAVVTRGRRGASLFVGDDRLDQRSIPVEETEPTGAGDAFAAAFVVRYCETGDLPRSLAFAAAAGALAVTGPGVGGLKDRDAIERLLAGAPA